MLDCNRTQLVKHIDQNNLANNRRTKSELISPKQKLRINIYRQGEDVEKFFDVVSDEANQVQVVRTKVQYQSFEVDINTDLFFDNAANFTHRKCQENAGNYLEDYRQAETPSEQPFLSISRKVNVPSQYTRNDGVQKQK